MSRWVSGNRFKLLENGEDFFPRVFKCIAAARTEVILETFILFEDKVGLALHAALISATRNGARVDITIDGYGSPDLSADFISTLTQAGVRVHVFDPGPKLWGWRTNLFRRMQLVSAGLYSLGHGGNDAQKIMGIIAVPLLSQGRLQGEFHVPFWVVLSCQAAMALGTMAGGWRIVRTMGSRITHLTPMQGFCAETGGAAALFGATWLGVPVSTTHTIAGSIVGVGAARRVSAVRWGVARGIVVAWVVTLPAAAAVGAACYTLAALLMRR